MGQEEKRKAKLKPMAAKLLAAGGLIGLSYWWINHERYVEYEEEVMLGDPPKLEVIKRREVSALRVNQLQPKWTYIRSEVFLFGRTQPVWTGRLRPLYLDRLNKENGYLLIAGIQNGWECYERGRPQSYYVTIKITPNETIEIPTPAYLEGKPTNLLLRWGDIPRGQRRVSIAEKEHLNNLYYKPALRMQRILLSSKFDC